MLSAYRPLFKGSITMTRGGGRPLCGGHHPKLPLLTSPLIQVVSEDSFCFRFLLFPSGRLIIACHVFSTQCSCQEQIEGWGTEIAPHQILVPHFIVAPPTKKLVGGALNFIECTIEFKCYSASFFYIYWFLCNTRKQLHGLGMISKRLIYLRSLTAQYWPWGEGQIPKIFSNKTQFSRTSQYIIVFNKKIYNKPYFIERRLFCLI